jgi:hypothetical protein
MQATGSSRLLVVDGGRLVGIVGLKDLLRFLQRKIELERESGAAGGSRSRYRPGRRRRATWPRRAGRPAHGGTRSYSLTVLLPPAASQSDERSRKRLLTRSLLVS